MFSVRSGSFAGQSNDAPIDLTQGPSHVEVPCNAVSTINKIQSQDARKLCIYDICYKLKHAETYDIGGSYINTEPDLWFYYTTSICPGHNYLLNLFVCHRKVGHFTLWVSNSNELTHKKRRYEVTGQSLLPDSLSSYAFKSSQPDESHYIKTFCFSENDLKSLENSTLFVSINIELNTTHTLNNEVIKRIKLEHDFRDLLSKQEKTDFVLQSASKKQFQTHKIMLVAHSPILRNILKNSTSTSAFIDVSDGDMELLLQFIYTGTIKDILKQDCLKLLEIADRFQLQNLFLLTQYAISEQINVNNAVEIALISEKYKLERLQFSVFNFIKNNPEALETDGWKNLKDVDLAKKLIKFIHNRRD